MVYTGIRSTNPFTNTKFIGEVLRDNSNTYLEGWGDEILMVRRIPRIVMRRDDFFRMWCNYCYFSNFFLRENVYFDKYTFSLFLDKFSQISCGFYKFTTIIVPKKKLRKAPSRYHRLEHRHCRKSNFTLTNLRNPINCGTNS